MKKPNLFEFATSELSQDAFICWLLSWAAPCYKSTHSQLNACACDFLRECFLKHGTGFPAEIQSVSVSRQHENIDVLCVVNGTFAVLIEDKTHTSQHSDQLERYFAGVRNRGFAVDNILAIYLKTRDQSDYGPVTLAGYQPFLRGDLLAILNRYEAVESDIFQDFRACLNSIEREVNSFRELPLNQWSWNSWIGFYGEMKKAFPDGNWDYVANPSGGFLGFWFSWHHNAYLQMEQEKFCFKIEVEGREEQPTERQNWHDVIMAAGTAAGIKLRKPDRFGLGTWMTVCVLDEEYRQTKDGVLDVGATAEFVKRLSALLKSVALPA
jgi:hypothetical protein